jgi:hypothetical protein
MLHVSSSADAQLQPMDDFSLRAAQPLQGVLHDASTADAHTSSKNQGGV